MSYYGPDWGMIAARKAQAVAYHNLKEIEKGNALLAEKDQYIQQLEAYIRELEAKRKIGSVNFLIERGRYLGFREALRDITGETDKTISKEDSEKVDALVIKRIREQQEKLGVPENKQD